MERRNARPTLTVDLAQRDEVQITPLCRAPLDEGRSERARRNRTPEVFGMARHVNLVICHDDVSVRVLR